jgi:hypothetical protein
VSLLDLYGLMFKPLVERLHQLYDQKGAESVDELKKLQKDIDQLRQDPFFVQHGGFNVDSLLGSSIRESVR